ncbi:MAG TPA: rhomboid family intramembrane serine protease, partial [Rhodocyclaceae bacterium]|nr:rhomboid family intramembrane serine protease [Rhodocyclaceae bacterium]
MTATSKQDWIDRLGSHATSIPATKILIVANSLVFAAMLLAGAGLWHSPNGIQLEWGANFGPATKNGEWWRLGTAMFLHFGLLHLAMNMWALWDGGRLVERLIGSGRFLLGYFAAGLTGNLLSLVTHGDQTVSGGASGAVFGVYGALLLLLWRQRRNLHPGEFRWLFWGAGAFTVASILFGLLVPGIDNAAHLGGFVAGTLACAALVRPEASTASPMKQTPAAAAALLAGGIVALVTHIPEPAYRWNEEKAARLEIREFMGEDAAISARWTQILEEARRQGLSFDQLAERIDAGVTGPYEQSFEQLSGLNIDPRAPSAGTVQALRRYAELRRDSSVELADALRRRNPQRIQEALKAARQAKATAESKPPAAAPQQP